MTENRRVFLNITATYARSLYALVLGLLCGRWTLMALGETDFGLNGLVGGLTVFIAFFNGVLAGANGRFYAFSVGAAKVATDKDEALEECRRWFNTALSVHSVVPLVLIAIGYPVGVYAVEHWLTIPPERIHACVWVFRFVCLSCFIGMLNVPFTAMYNAKQYIAELTIYSFITSTLNVLVLHYMVTHPDVWLIKYAAWTCALSVIPQIIICIRACIVFKECRVNLSYMWDISRLKKLFGFVGWTLIGCICVILRTNGITIVINKFFGASMNAAQALGNTVQSHCQSLAGAMQSAFVPVITQACGAGDYVTMNKFVLRVSKFNVVLSAIFMLPLALELPKVMVLWLKKPPEYTIGLCYCAMLYYLASASTVGHMIAVNAVGKLALYHIVLASISVFTLPIAVFFGFVWRNVYIVMAVVICMEFLNSIGRVVFARRLAGTSIRSWVVRVCCPLLGVLLLCAGVGYLPHLWMKESFVRIIMTTVVCETVFLPLIWFMVFSPEERQFVQAKIVGKVMRLVRKTNCA